MTFHTPSFGDEDFDLPPLNLPSEQGSSYPSSRTPVSARLGMQATACSQVSSLNDMNSLTPKFPPQNFDVPDISVTNSLGHHSAPLYSSDHLMSSRQTPLTTISQSQMANQLGFQTALKQGSPPMSNSASSPSRESSEDSDDSLPLAQLVSMKRAANSSSPDIIEPHVAVPSVTTKKQKTPKKKKKKDPNEPQKPVSAYALFFRDTQAAIKGQNPNASFGEVSKIVASMWDGLEPEYKNVYKTKTEVAKKEYLKQLAAYRASLVSQGGVDEGSSHSEKSPSPPSHPSPSTMAASPPPPHPQRTGSSINNLVPLTHPQPTPMMGGYAALQGLGSMTQMTPVQSPPHLMVVSHNNMVYHSPLSQGDQLIQVGMDPNGLCVRTGCGNNALENPGWDNEYCSSDCVVRHCRDVFTGWVVARQSSDSYPVK